MSASPAGNTPGRTPNGTTVPPPIRRTKPGNPLVQPRRRPAKPHGALSSAPKSNGGPSSSRPLGLAPGAPQQLAPGKAPLAPGKSSSLTPRPVQIQNPAHHNPTLGLLGAAEAIPSGFSSEPVAPYTDYPLMMSKRQIMEGLRHHVARFYSKKNIDPRDEGSFTRPVRLSRRDARHLAQAKDGEGENKEADAEERERQQLLRAQREAEREVQMAEVAPSASSSGSRRLGGTNKKTQQVFRYDQTDEQKARTKLRYEEALQWHLEDFDNKQSWVGSYEAALSETYASMVFKDGKFNLVPVEKWYKFTPRLNFKTMGLEEAEKQMEKTEKKPEWLQKADEQARERKLEMANRRATSRLYVGSLKDEADLAGSSRRESGFDELDFEEDRFADDEEPDLFEGDPDDLKRTADRIRRDHLQANIFDMKEEKAYDKEEAFEKQQKKDEKEHGKRVKKALMKRERNFVYDSDSDKNPYSSESESTDSEAERQKEEQAKKEAEEKAKGSQGASGSSTKGNNTPSGRASKHPDPSRLKPSSANVSDASGNESSRKLPKKSSSSKLGTGTNTPNGIKSRSRSPAPSSDPSSLQNKSGNIRVTSNSDSLKRPRGGASGSDGEGAGSGGDMSDGSRKRIKVKGPASAGVSRNASVEPRSRAMSPGENKMPPMPSAADISAAIPDSGISMVQLFRMFGGSQDATRKQDLLKLLRPISRYDKATKMLRKINT